MKLALSASAPKADVLFVLLWQDQKLSANDKKILPKEAVSQTEMRMKAKDFTGAEGESLTLYTEKANWKKVVLVGRGKKEEQMPQALEYLGGKLVGMAKGLKAKSAAVLVEGKELSELAYGAALGGFEYNEYKKVDKKAPQLGSFTFVSENNKENKATLARVQVFQESSALTRSLINRPTGELNTQDLTNEATKVAKKYKLKVTVLDDKKMKKLGMNAIVGVGKGAEVGARMVILEYRNGSKAKEPNIAFVGKGIVFDTGGINLKPTGYIELMKEDMAGAATVLGAMQSIAQMKLKGYYIGVLCCAENAISDRAQRPGDVVKAYNGKTIEITNTDAEGRLALADGLSYTEKHYKPKVMVNIATLTGAVSYALGHHITGYMGNDQKLLDEIKTAAEAVHERVWQLPLDDDFIKATKGDFTDLKNSTNGVKAGSSMGGAFLKNFVDKVRWAHFDIGGTAWAEKPTPTTKYGATGVALRTFMELAKRHEG